MPRNVTYTLEKAQDDEGGMIAKPGPSDSPPISNGSWVWIPVVLLLAYMIFQAATTVFQPTGFGL